MTYLNQKDRVELFRTALKQTRSGSGWREDPKQAYVYAYTEVYDALGMSKAQKDGRTLPDREETLVVNGVTWHLKPRGPKREYTQFGVNRIVKSAKHRLFIQCPCCDKEIPAGRLHQHADVHPETKGK